MKIQHILIIVFIVTTFSRCINKVENEDNIFSVDLNKITEVPFINIFSNIEIIPLETNENSLIMDVSKVIYFNNKYFVLDRKNWTIFIFDNIGNFCSKISNKGSGPNQYINIDDFEIYKKNNSIVLLSAFNKTLYEYDLDGNFITKNELPNLSRSYKSFNFINNDTLVFFTFDQKNRIKFISKTENSIIRETFPEKDNMLNNFSRYEFPFENYFIRSADNTVYIITQDCQLIESHTWDFGKLNNSSIQITAMEKVSLNDSQMYGSKIWNSEVINYIFATQSKTPNFFYTQIWRKNKLVNIFYNPTTKKEYVFEKTAEGARFFPLFWRENYVIGIHIEELGSLDETIPNTILDEKNIKIKEQLDEYDNPVLIKYYFND